MKFHPFRGQRVGVSVKLSDGPPIQYSQAPQAVNPNTVSWMHWTNTEPSQSPADSPGWVATAKKEENNPTGLQTMFYVIPPDSHWKKPLQLLPVQVFLQKDTFWLKHYKFVKRFSKTWKDLHCKHLAHIQGQSYTGWYYMLQYPERAGQGVL